MRANVSPYLPAREGNLGFFPPPSSPTSPSTPRQSTSMKVPAAAAAAAAVTAAVVVVAGSFPGPPGRDGEGCVGRVPESGERRFHVGYSRLAVLSLGIAFSLIFDIFRLIILHPHCQE